MITKLPRWIWGVSWVLTFCAGIINAVGLLGLQHQAVTHLTGTTTLLGTAMANRNGLDILHLLSVLGAFVLGNALSGLLLPKDPLLLVKRHGMVLILESVMLFVAVPLLNHGNLLGDYLASAACGLQNGMASIFSGFLIRTTHVSGMFTDLGIFLGHFLKGVPIDRRRMKLCLTVISAFLLGGVVGAAGFPVQGYTVLVLPASIVGTGAVIYLANRIRRSRHLNL